MSTAIQRSAAPRKRRWWLATVVFTSLSALLLAACGSGSRQPQTNADGTRDLAAYFSGRTITFIAVSDAGGGQDIICRTLAKYMPKYIPGAPSIVVKNVPGAGGLVGENEIAHAKPDGFTWGPAFPTTAVFAALSNSGGISFKMDELTWIGNGLSEPRMLWARTDRYPDLNSILNSTKPMRMGSTGPEHPDTVVARAVAKALGFKAEIITGYDGTGDVMLDVERGQLDGRVSAWLSISLEQPTWVQKDFVRPLVYIGAQRDPNYPNVPALGELVQDQTLISAAVIPYGISRSFNGPAGIDADIAAMMRTAYESAVKDPAFQEEMKKLGYGFRLTTADQLKADVNRVLNEPAVRDGILALMKEK